MVDRQFFRNSFGDSTYRATKQALISQLTDIARDPIMRQFTCHQSSFNFFAALDSGKVIVVQFDPSLHSRDTIRTIGQLINAAILSHVLGRSGQFRHPIHLFIDECQFFVSPTIAEILGESRKFGLYLSLATQRIERLETALQDAILGNVGTLWIGSSRNVTAEKLARETDISAGKIRQLPNLQFFEAGIGKPVIRRSLKRYALHERGMRPKSYKSILATLNMLSQWAETQEVEQLNHGIVREFLYWGREERAWEARTFRNHRQYLSSFFSWCVRQGIIKHDPTNGIEKPKLPQRLPRCLTRQQTHIILSHVRWQHWRYQYEGVRNEMILYLLVYSGLRLQEMLDLEVSDVNLSSGEIFVRQGKGRKDRMTSQQTQAERFDDRVCGVCARTAAGHGYAPKSHMPVIWCCDDLECIQIARNSYHMKQEEFTRLEAIAANEARFDVGDYMEKIGKTDLASMTLEEAMKMCQITVAAYRKNLKKLVSAYFEAIHASLGIEEKKQDSVKVVCNAVFERSDYDFYETSLDELEELLTYIPSTCDYDQWLKVLQAIHDVTGGSQVGLDLASRWSSPGWNSKHSQFKNVDQEVASKWRSFRSGGITIATIAEIAGQNGADLSAIAGKHVALLNPVNQEEANRISAALMESFLAKQKAKAISELEWFDDVKPIRHLILIQVAINWAKTVLLLKVKAAVLPKDPAC